MKKYNQFDLIKTISAKEGLESNIVRKIFKSTENIICDLLSSEEYKEKISVQPFQGVIITRNYKPKREYKGKGLFQQLEVPERVKVDAHISKRYNQNINDSVFK